MFSKKVDEVLNELGKLLKAKNKAYGNSALEPLRVFSKADTIEQLNVRIDDKLSRIAKGSASGEDAEWDLMGYLVLKRIAMMSGVQTKMDLDEDMSTKEVCEALEDECEPTFEELHAIHDTIAESLGDSIKEAVKRANKLGGAMGFKITEAGVEPFTREEFMKGMKDEQ